MGRPYSYDLRKKAIDLRERGESLSYISNLLRISPRTITNWVRRKKETGDIMVDARCHRGHSHKIVNLSEFREFAELHKECTLKKMAETYGNISYSTIYRNLIKIGFR